MPPPPKPELLGDHAAPRTSRSSWRTYDGTFEPLSVDGPMSQDNHPEGASLESLSPALPLPFRLDRERDRDRNDDLSLPPLLLDSGGSMNDTRFGVDRPDAVMPIASDTLSQLLLSESAGDVGVGGADRPLRPLSAEWRGGLGGRVDDVCRPLV